ncbi:hypothetical protein A6R68_17082, partial [Neotoma lepida]
MFIMLRQKLLQALAEGLQLLFAPEALGTEELRDECSSGTDLASHDMDQLFHDIPTQAGSCLYQMAVYPATVVSRGVGSPLYAHKYPPPLRPN